MIAEIVWTREFSGGLQVSFKLDGRLMRTFVWANDYTQTIETARIVVMRDIKSDFRRLPRNGPAERNAKAAVIAAVKAAKLNVPQLSRSES